MNSSKQETNPSPLLKSIYIKAVFFAVAYFACAMLGNLLSIQSISFVNFWLPSGLFVAVLLINEKRHWPLLVFAAIIANNCFDLWNGKDFTVSVPFSITNSLESIIGA